MINLDATNSGGLMDTLAKSAGSAIENGLLLLPETFGEGYIKGFNLGPFLQMMIHQYELKEDVTLKKKATPGGSGTVTFSFRNVFNQPTEQKDHYVSQRSKCLPSVQVSSAGIDIEIFAPAKTKINTILITTQVDLLRNVMNQQEDSSLLQTILSDNQPYIYEELVSPEIQKVAAEIITANTPDQLQDFYFKIKAQELICLFFIELVKRGQFNNYPLKVSDVKTMYVIRDRLLADLSQVPNVPELARLAGMSESKMKRLFRQIFGNSIYNYYQTFRMNEAAYLLKEHKLSVSETGYQLGFANLSHFSRIFEKHMGYKPKKYSTTY